MSVRERKSYCHSAHSRWLRLKICERMSNIDQGAGQLAIDGERREKCVKLVGVGMSANHDIKSQPPAAHFTTILCTKSQQSRFVALPRQLPHLKKFKSLTEREGGRACNIVSHLRFCVLLLRPKQPSSLNWQVFIRWHILPLVSILRRWRKRRCSIGNSILGRPPPPSHPSRAEGHQPICHLLPPTIPPSGIFKVTMPLCNCSLKLSSPGVNLYHKEFNQLLKRTDFELDLVFDKRVSSCWGKLRLNPDFRTPPISAVVRDGMSVISENHRLITAG